MDLDILLPIHRIDNYLRLALTSINNSKGISFRLIVIDDRFDKSEKLYPLVKKFDNLEIIETAGNMGYGFALEAGSSAVESTAVALANSDDLIDELKYFKQMNLLDKNDIVLTNIRRITKAGKPSTSLSGSIKCDEYSPSFLLLGSYGADASWCMTKAWWKNHSFFDGKDFLDWRIAMRSFSKSKIGFINEDLYFYRRHPMQISIKNRKVNSFDTSIFSDWEKFARILGMEKISIEMFNFFAIPWAKNTSINFEDVIEFTSSLRNISRNQSIGIQKQIDRLIQRRFLLQLGNSNLSYPERLRIIADNSGGIKSLMLDLVKN